MGDSMFIFFFWNDDGGLFYDDSTLDRGYDEHFSR